MFCKKRTNSLSWTLKYIGNALRCESKEETRYFEISKLRGEGPYKQDGVLSVSKMFFELCDYDIDGAKFVFNEIIITRVEEGYLVLYNEENEAYCSILTLDSLNVEIFLENINKDFLRVKDEKNSTNRKSSSKSKSNAERNVRRVESNSDTDNESIKLIKPVFDRGERGSLYSI